VLEELIRVNMLYGYFGLCIQDYNIHIYIYIYMRKEGYVKNMNVLPLFLYRFETS
jgi:hypothetical protein